MKKSISRKLKRVRDKREKRRVKKTHEDDFSRQRRAERQDERDKAEAVATRGQICADAKKVERQKQAYKRGKL